MASPGGEFKYSVCPFLNHSVRQVSQFRNSKSWFNPGGRHKGTGFKGEK